MLEPSIDELQKKINSKYKLVTISARRAREIRDTQKLLIDEPKSKNYVGMALEEIHAGKITIVEP